MNRRTNRRFNRGGRRRRTASRPYRGNNLGVTSSFIVRVPHNDPPSINLSNKATKSVAVTYSVTSNVLTDIDAKTLVTNIQSAFYPTIQAPGTGHPVPFRFTINSYTIWGTSGENAQIRVTDSFGTTGEDVGSELMRPKIRFNVPQLRREIIRSSETPYILSVFTSGTLAYVVYNVTFWPDIPDTPPGKVKLAPTASTVASV